MKYLILLLLLTSCASTYRVVSPHEAIALCGKRGVKSYVALSGVIECTNQDK